MKRNRRFFGFFFFIFVIILSQLSFSQIEQDAATSIQNAQEKLIEVIILLEESSEKKIEVLDLVIKADLARKLIKEANEEYIEEDYVSALQKANEAIKELDGLIEEITELLESTKQKSRILFSLLGSTLAFLSIFLIFIFFKKIYPWYKKKQLEEYGNLVILYEETQEEIKND